MGGIVGNSNDGPNQTAEALLPLLLGIDSIPNNKGIKLSLGSSVYFLPFCPPTKSKALRFLPPHIWYVFWFVSSVLVSYVVVSTVRVVR